MQTLCSDRLEEYCEAMNTRELLQYECEQVGKQIVACLEAMPEVGFDTRCTEKGMTPREMLAHLAEAYQAFLLATIGEKHDWGSYTVEDQSTENLRAVWTEQRSKAVQAALFSDDDHVIKEAYDYIIGHDNYHVAQLVQSRVLVQPDWDAYGIYG
jgi:hypothetical protein